MGIDRFRNQYHRAPAVDMFSVTPDDDNDLSSPARGLYVGTSGDVRLTTPRGTTVTLPSLAAGVVHPIAAKRIHSTGTTASDIFGVTQD